MAKPDLRAALGALFAPARRTDQLERIEARLADMWANAPIPLLARPGQVLTSGTGFRWIAYELEGGALVAACYVRGRLLRRDARGWYFSSYWGRPDRVTGNVVAALGGTAPAGWPVHPEQWDLCEVIDRAA